MDLLCRVSSDRELAGKLNDPGKKPSNGREFRLWKENPGIFIQSLIFKKKNCEVRFGLFLREKRTKQNHFFNHFFLNFQQLTKKIS